MTILKHKLCLKKQYQEPDRRKERRRRSDTDGDHRRRRDLRVADKNLPGPGGDGGKPGGVRPDGTDGADPERAERPDHAGAVAAERSGPRGRADGELGNRQSQRERRHQQLHKVFFRAAAERVLGSTGDHGAGLCELLHAERPER